MAMLLSALMSISIFSGCQSSSGGDASASDVIKIGVFQPLTGDYAGGGEIEVEGIRLANELYPEVLGKKVELVVVDNKSDKAESATSVARLIEQDKVTALIGSYSSALSIPAGNIIKDAKVPALGATCTNPQVTLNNDYYFRVCFIDPFQGTVAANYATTKLGAKTAAILQEVSNDYSVGLANFFKEDFIKITGDPNAIVDIENYQTGDKDFSAALTNIKSKNPDVIFAPGNFTESALAVKQARLLGIETPFLGGDTWETPDFLSVGGAEVEGVTFSAFFDKNMATTEEAAKFFEEYEKRHPGQEAAAATALGYDAYILLLDAITRANSTDKEAIRDALAQTSNFLGVTGSTTLDANGDAVKDAVIKVVENGAFKYLDVVSAQ
jgi:branched-chain amino acid transport system substrate-binding protein